MTKDILLIVFGAIAGGILQFFSGILERRRMAESTLTAIASEVDSICRLICHQRYLEAYEKLATNVSDGTWKGNVWIIDIRSNYFTVYEALAHNLGLLKPSQLNRIVNFYAYCKSAIDSTRPDGPAASTFDTEDKANGIIGTLAVLHSILALGGEITTFPKKKLDAGLIVDEPK